MAILLDLANELLLQILESLTPIEMVSLATSCKRIHTLAQDNLTLHRQRVERYQNVTLWGCLRHQDQPHPILLLRDICNDWRVAYYARSLVIECCGELPSPMDAADSDWDDFPPGYSIAQDDETIRSVLPEITVSVRKMLRMALRWNEAKVDAALDLTEHGVRGAILGLLIVSLPAIISISFKNYVWIDELWEDSIESITEQQNPDSDFGEDSIESITDQQNPYSGSSEASFLTDLSELNLEDNLEQDQSDGMWGSVAPFVSLPSLRVIRGASINSYSFNTHSFHEHATLLRSSPVIEIDLQRSTLAAYKLPEILMYMQALKRFRYDRGRQSELMSDGAEPGRIIHLLLACASCSLENLALTGATAYRSPHDEDVKGSMRDFKVLKDIHLPSNAFLTYASKGDCRSLPTEDIPRLVDVLPASIETVRLDGEISWEEIAALLVGLSEGKAECLPKIKEIFFTVKNDRGKAHKQRTEALAHLRQKQGIMLQLDKAVESAFHYSGRFVF